MEQNKKLYEKIMKNVSRQVKKALNEDRDEAMARERAQAAKALIKIIKDSEYEYEYPEMLNRNEFMYIADMVSRYFMHEFGIPEEEINKDAYIMALKLNIANFRNTPINRQKFVKLPTPDNIDERLFKLIIKNMSDEKIQPGEAAVTIIKAAQKLKISAEKITEFVIHFAQWTYMNIAD